MEIVSFIVGVIGNIISVFLVFAPIKTFIRIVKRRSTENFESLPYVVAVAGTSLWCYYAISKPDDLLLATINGFAAIIELVYVIIFLIFAPPRIRAKTAVVVGTADVGFPVAVILVTRLMMDGDLRIDVLGYVCAVLSVLMYGSPLAAMKRVVTTKSVEYMPFLLSLFLFLNGGIWTLYAILGKDFFLGVPNGIGFLLGIAQMLLYAMYWKRKPSLNISDDLEYGWQHKHLIHGNSDDLEV